MPEQDLGDGLAYRFLFLEIVNQQFFFQRLNDKVFLSGFGGHFHFREFLDSLFDNG